MKTKFILLAACAALVMNVSCSDSDEEPSTDPTVENPDEQGKPQGDKTEKDTTGPYELGDFYKEGKVEGVVFRINDDGTHGLIVSLDEAQNTPWAVLSSTTTGGMDHDFGSVNAEKVKALPDWESLYPAYKWCFDHNKDGVDGWYLPAVIELQSLYFVFDGTYAVQVGGSARQNFNKRLTAHGGTALTSSEYWSSSECSDIAASMVNFTDQFTSCGIKTNPIRVRAVREF